MYTLTRYYVSFTVFTYTVFNERHSKTSINSRSIHIHINFETAFFFWTALDLVSFPHGAKLK